MLRTADLDYDLPEDLIATVPSAHREEARLLVTGRGADASVTHARVKDLAEFLRPGDVLVFNTTRVIPARLVGVRRDTGGAVEGLFLGESEGGGRSGCAVWRVLLRAKRLRPGCVVDLRPVREGAAGASLVIESEGADGPGSWIARALDSEPGSTLGILERVGRTPLPPYILGARKRGGAGLAEDEDRERYQTVYARTDQGASVAAPTAGLHFTEALLAQLASRGVRRVAVTLHVGPGTFKPVETESVEAHPMHAEWCRADPAELTAIRDARAAGGRVFAVGTTAARAIESLAEVAASESSAGVWTRLLITPGYRWRLVEGLLTNFHLPRSTLMALVAALLDGGAERLRAIYAEAVGRRYRFYSYGDAMLVLP